MQINLKFLLKNYNMKTQSVDWIFKDRLIDLTIENA